MKLTDKQKEVFKKAAPEGKVFTIYGFNDLAQPFQTKGRVTLDDNKKPCVLDGAIFFEFGKPKANYGFRGEVFVPFLTDYYHQNQMLGGPNLIIDKITDEQGNVVFKNVDIDKYYTEAQKHGEKERKKREAEGRYISDEYMDPVSRKLKEFIGKPIIVNGEEPKILLEYGYLLNNGMAVSDVATGEFCSGLFVNEFSVLRTVDLDGNRIIVEKNDPEKVSTIFEKRAKKINEVQKNAPGNGE